MEGTGETDWLAEQRGFEPLVPLANEWIIRDRVEGVIDGSDPVNGGSNQTRIVEFVASSRLPAIYV
jgi:hypothetical protein